jgi:hypothetical protein
MGEIPGEQTSLASRTKNSDTAELPDLEREIFRILLTEAYLTASSDTPRHKEFYKFQGMIRREIGNSAVSDAVSQHKLAIKIRELVARYDSDHASDRFPGKIARRIREWLQDFDAIEIKDKNAEKRMLFVGYCAKAAEHIQGTRHLIRFATIHPDDKRLNLAFTNSHPNAPRDHLSQANPEAMIPMRYTSWVTVDEDLDGQDTLGRGDPQHGTRLQPGDRAERQVDRRQLEAQLGGDPLPVRGIGPGSRWNGGAAQGIHVDGFLGV